MESLPIEDSREPLELTLEERVSVVICTQVMQRVCTALYSVTPEDFDRYVNRFEKEQASLTPEEYRELVTENPSYGLPMLKAFRDFRKRLEELKDNASTTQAAGTDQQTKDGATGS